MSYNLDRRRLAEVSYPANPDAWSESLTPNEGYWIGGGSYGDISLDLVNKAVGSSSIRCNSNTDGSIVAIFELHDGYEYDATKKNAKFNFLHSLEPNKMNGTCTIALEDKSGNRVLQDFGTQPIGAWETKMFPLGPDKGWIPWIGTIDWTKIKKIVLYASCRIYDGFSWVDEPHFSYEMPDGILRVQSSPTGKSGTITLPDGTYDFITPSQITRAVETEATISMDTANFKQWDGGNSSTNPILTTIFVLGITTLTAYYETAQLPLLNIYSYDQNMNAYPANQGVKLIYKGIEQYVDVPFASRVSKGDYSFVVVETETRKLDFWKKPDGTTSTDKSIDVSIQDNIGIEVHWKVSQPSITNMIPIALVAIGFIFAGYLIFKKG